MKNLRNITLILLVAFLSILFAEKTIQVPLKKRVVISSHDETDQIYQRLFININHGKIGVEKVCYSYEDDECTYYTKDTYRTAFKFNLTNIPDDAEITDAWIKVSITNLGADADTSWEAAIKPVIKDIEDNSNSPSSLFNDMADGTQYFSDSEITFGDDDPTTYRDDNLITNIQSNLEEKNWIAFGIYSQEEAPFGENEFGYGDARAKLELYVTYYREHDITVETSFDGGYLKLDGNQINEPINSFV